jgi:hypothetical protein
MVAESRTSILKFSWLCRAQDAVQLLIKLLLLPFRFVWLLLVWLRLRRRATKAAS